MQATTPAGNSTVWRVAVASLVAAVAACSNPAHLQRAVTEEDLPASVELAGTPFFAQTEYQCGPAALATLLGAAGVAVTPAALVNEIYLPGRQGSLQPEIIAALRARGFVPYVVAPDFAALLGELAAMRPVLVLQKLGAGPWPAWHYAVVVGYDAARDHLVLRSGAEARQVVSVKKFMLSWDRAERWALVALPAGEIPAAADFTHYMAAVAGLEAMGRWQGEARKAYEAATQAWPDESLPWLGLANIAAADADWVTAERGFRAALARNPRDLAAHNNHAESLRQLGCFAAAKTAIAHAQQLAAPAHPLREAVEATAMDLAGAAGAAGTEPDVCREFTAAAAP
jgi:tetratricopeptide (TPR) repeat protein